VAGSSTLRLKGPISFLIFACMHILCGPNQLPVLAAAPSGFYREGAVGNPSADFSKHCRNSFRSQVSIPVGREGADCVLPGNAES